MTIRVLLIDDDEAVLVTLARALSIRRDIEIVGAAVNGEDAVALATRVPADVIVMDELMPQMSGLDAVRRLRGSGIDTPVLMFTSDESAADRGRHLARVRFLSKGRDGFRAVPIAVRALAANDHPVDEERHG